MIETILYPLAFMGGMGLLFGLGLAFASKKLAVELDERVEHVRDCLPGANCGGCGYPGCDAYANAVVEAGASVTLCFPGGVAVADGISKVMGVDAGEVKINRKVANVICRGSCANAKIRFDYQGEKSCKVVALASEGDKSCRYACVGYGDCVKVCPFDALIITDDRIVSVDEEKCTGCGRCVRECPKNVIRIEPHYDVRVRCRALEKGKIVRDSCSAGCISCGKCLKSCKFDAIIMKDNLPAIDRAKCVGCLECAKNCPTGAMEADLDRAKTAVIDGEKCIGCTLCKKQCRFDAISGEVKEAHIIDAEKCVGCGLCAEKCPKDAIEIKTGAVPRTIEEPEDDVAEEAVEEPAAAMESVDGEDEKGADDPVTEPAAEEKLIAEDSEDKVEEPVAAIESTDNGSEAMIEEPVAADSLEA